MISDAAENLALACHRCNRHKGPNLSSIDEWKDHFRMVDEAIVGLTEVGRATVSLLQMNALIRLELRRWLARP